MKAHFKIDSEFRDLIPPLRNGELELLESSLIHEGCREPLIVWNDTLIDGHNRFTICKKEGLVYHTREIELADRNAAKLWIIDNQMGRRNIADIDRIGLQSVKEEVLREIGKVNLKASAELRRDSKGRLKPISAKLPKQANTRAACAKAAQVGERTYDAGKLVIEAAKTGEIPKETLEDIRSGKKAIHGVAKELMGQRKQKQKHETAAKLNGKPLPKPDGKFNVIVVDPPWKYEKRVEDTTHRARLLYPEMTTEEICKLPVAKLAEDDCVLWLWTTNAFMREAYQVLDAWGFKDKTILTWAKDKMGCGDWLRGKTEHCIMAIKGKPTVTLTNQTTLLHGQLREHSRKPDEFFHLVEKLCPGTRIELFAREQRKGWQAWGAETSKF